MSIASVGMIGPRAEPVRQEQPKEDNFDKLMKGLQFANGVLGIGVNFTTIQNNMAKGDAMAAEASGILTKGRESEMQASGLQSVAKGTQGAVDYNFREGDKTVTRSYLKAPTATAKAPAGPSLAETVQQERLQLDKDKFEWTKGQTKSRPASGGQAGGAPTPDGKPAPKQLSAAERQRFDSASMGLDAVVGMKDALKNNDNTFSVMGDNDFTRNRTKFEEALGRMQSGGAISDDEASRFRKMAPGMMDSPEQQQKKMDDLYAEMALRVKGLGGDPDQILSERNQLRGGSPAKPPSGTALGSDAKAAFSPQDIEAELIRRGLKPSPQPQQGNPGLRIPKGQRG